MVVPKEYGGIDARLVEVTRRMRPFAPMSLAPFGSPEFAVALLGAVAELGASTERPETGAEVIVSKWVRLVEGESAENVRCRIGGQGGRCAVTVDERLGVLVALGETPRVVGVMVLAPRSDDTLQPLSITCRLDDDGGATYEWRFGRDGRVYVVQARRDGEHWVATLERVLSPIEVGVVDPHLARETGATPAEAFDRVVPAMPQPQHAAAGVLPRHGLGTD
ncbi:hypothetical protein DSM104299_00941 [Baekduia alba]|uniref:hypothetical protein n=1 Tax=Baekduia alba TaxID=2997333 RepID=UPI00234067AD|nr:hypothetical protein [Baekduia alba]WCB92251.1 hypothetical protein DSM104299_00941 [Baekduia alba]